MSSDGVTSPGALDAPGGSGDSRPSKETNSVEASTGQSDFTDPLEEKVHERVLEFIEEYPELANTPLCETHGRKLRRIVTEAEYRDEWVEPQEPTENAFMVTELAKREAATWADALSAFLTAHTRYDGLMARFGNDEGDEFEIPLTDAWGEEYSKKQYARALALQRQMAGGERPSGGEAVAAWGSPATAMLTLTASSIPNGSRLPPVEHLDAVHDSFSYDGVRDTLRNTMEYHLSLDSDEWGYWLQAEPHGMPKGEDGSRGGMNACYTHLHVGVYFDLDPLGELANDLHQVGTEFERVIDKHLEVCEYAGRSAHNYEKIDDYEEDSNGCISLNASVENMGSYLAAYMGGYTESLLDKPVEYLAWGSIYWSAARRRTSRSKVLTEAIAADACEQRAESPEANQTDAHGESVIWDDGRGPDVVCECCNSGWAIDQSRLEEPVSDDDLLDALDGEDTEDSGELTLAERWPSVDAGVRIGESTTRTRIRKRVETELKYSDEELSVEQVLGRNITEIPIELTDFVKSVMNGEDKPYESFRRASLESEWRLEAIIDRDGEEHLPSGGGVDMVSLKMPFKRILDETRLQHDLEKGEMWRCSKCNFATHNEKIMARHFVNIGLEEPEAADHVLHVEDYYDQDRECMRHPLN
ncbi:hypothetical protein [Haloferax sp. DFSO60]|uniref:hypothetical protein n=1 Tax=Haloferax sp. DFSO60 TaxID=3388652 RepID=UPI0039791F37